MLLRKNILLLSWIMRMLRKEFLLSRTTTISARVLGGLRPLSMTRLVTR